MRESTEQLIQRLSDNAKPVQANASPLIRTFYWATAILSILALVAVWAGDMRSVLHHLDEPLFTLSTLAALITGLIAMFAAFSISVPGRIETWTWLILPAAGTWLVTSGLMCMQGMKAHEGQAFTIFASVDCFIFIMISGALLAFAFILALRKNSDLNAIRVTSLAGLSAAMLGITLLTFFHPPETDLIDFGTHVVATTVLMVFMATLGRWALKSS